MQINMKKLRIKRLTRFAAFCVAFSAMSFSADPAGPTSRRIDLDVAQAVRALDRFFDLSVGSDFPGTLHL
jgi:xylan 1,4-beta-xylosidase